MQDKGLAEHLKSAGITAGGLLIVCFFLSVLALYFPWWQGGRAGVSLGNDISLDWTARASLWVTKATIDDMPWLTRQVIKKSEYLSKLEAMLESDTSWDFLCDSSHADKLADLCLMITISRAMVILSSIFSLPSAVVLFFGSVLGSPQVLFIGGGLGFVCAIGTGVGSILGAVMSFDGLGATGYICVASAFGASMGGTALSTVFLWHELRQHERAAANEDEEVVDEAEGGSKLEAGRTVENRKAMAELAKQKEPEGPQIQDVSDLTEMWRTMDVAGDGKIPYDHFCQTLQNVCGLPSGQAVMNVLNEVDSDKGGTIEYPEFLAFFAQVEELNSFREKREFRGRLCQYLLAGYLVIGICCMFVFSCWEVSLKPADEGSQTQRMVSMGRLISTICMTHGMITAMLIPLFCIKCRRYITHFSGGTGMEKMAIALEDYMNRMNTAYRTPAPPEDYEWAKPPPPEAKPGREQLSYHNARAARKKEAETPSSARSESSDARLQWIEGRRGGMRHVTMFVANPEDDERPSRSSSRARSRESTRGPLPPQPLGLPAPPGGAAPALEDNPNRKSLAGGVTAHQAPKKHVGRIYGAYCPSDYEEAKELQEEPCGMQFNPIMQQWHSYTPKRLMVEAKSKTDEEAIVQASSKEAPRLPNRPASPSPSPSFGSHPS